MSRYPVSDETWKQLLEVTLSKIDQADSKDTFYLCMALDKGTINPKLVKSDFYYTLYLNASRFINEYDLF